MGRRKLLKKGMRDHVRKSRKDKILAGCLAGIAEYYGWDPTITRVVYVFLSLFIGFFPGVLIYIILVFLMPER